MPKYIDIASILIIGTALLSSPAMGQNEDQPFIAQQRSQIGEWALEDTVFADETRSVSMSRPIGAGSAVYAVLAGSRRMARISTEECGLSIGFQRGAPSASAADAAEQFAAIYSDPEMPCSVGTPDGSLSEAELAPAIAMLERWVEQEPFPVWMVWETVRGSTQHGDFGFGVTHFEGGLQVDYLVPEQGSGPAELRIRMIECDALWEDLTDIAPPDAARAEQVAQERLAHFAADCGFDPNLPTQFVQGLEAGYVRAAAIERAHLDGN